MVKRTVRRRLRGGDDPVAPAAPAAPAAEQPGILSRAWRGLTGAVTAVKDRITGAPATETPAAAPASGSDGVPAGGRRRKTTRLSRRARRTRRQGRKH